MQSTSRQSLAMILITLGFLIMLIISLKIWTLDHLQGAERLQWLWQSDLEDLKIQGKLPKEFGQAREFAVQTSSDKTLEWAKIIKVPARIDPKGGYRLQVLLVDWSDPDGGEGVVIQHNLVDLKSNNMIWELNRHYILK